MARNCVRKRVDEKALGDKEGPPGLGISADRYRTSALEPAREPSSLGGIPGVTGETVARRREATREGQRASDLVREAALEVGGRQTNVCGLLYGSAALFPDLDSVALLSLALRQELRSLSSARHGLRAPGSPAA